MDTQDSLIHLLEGDCQAVLFAKEHLDFEEEVFIAYNDEVLNNDTAHARKKHTIMETCEFSESQVPELDMLVSFPIAGDLAEALSHIIEERKKNVTSGLFKEQVFKRWVRTHHELCPEPEKRDENDAFNFWDLFGLYAIVGGLVFVGVVYEVSTCKEMARVPRDTDIHF